MMQVIKENKVLYAIVFAILIVSLIYGATHMPDKSDTDSVEPQPTEVVSSKEPIIVKESEDGSWRAYRGDVVDTSFTGLASNDYGWWYVTNGVVDFSYNGSADNEYGSWLVKDGKLTEPAWHQTFRENGYSDSEIAEYQSIFDSIGVGNFSVMDFIDGSPGLRIMRAKPYNTQQDVQLNVGFENGHIFYVDLSGELNNLADPSNTDKKTVRLYDVDEGGKLAVLDWNAKNITNVN